MPEALHSPVIEEGYTWPTGELLMIAVMLIAGVCQLAAYNMAGASKNLGGWLVLEGIMSIVWAVGALVDPYLGTFCFEWVNAVFIGLLGVMVLLSGFCGGRVIGYKAWALECLLGIVLVAFALFIVLNSAYAITWLGAAFIVYGVVVALTPVAGSSIALKA
jgi:uncharacterized membrane protein HdeD (DUF308 family)